MSDQPLVQVGIVIYNSLGDLPVCLASVQRQTYPNMRVVLFDNGSQDGSAAWVKANFPDVPILESHANLGFGRAHNHLLRFCNLGEVDFYLPLNPDVTLDPHYVERLLAALLAHDAGWGSGKLLEKDAADQPTGLIYSAGQGIRRDGLVINVGEAMPDQGQFDTEREVFLVSGAAPLIRQQLIAAIAEDGDLFDPAMFLYAEDIDMGWRARRGGWRCWYAPEAVAYHRGGSIDASVRAQALGNLILMSVNNADWVDLGLIDLPLFLANWLIHAVVHPRPAWATARQVIRGFPAAWKKRQPSRISRDERLCWFHWSAGQPTAQPTSLAARLRAYLKRQ